MEGEGRPISSKTPLDESNGRYTLDETQKGVWYLRRCTQGVDCMELTSAGYSWRKAGYSFPRPTLLTATGKQDEWHCEVTSAYRNHIHVQITTHKECFKPKSHRKMYLQINRHPKVYIFMLNENTH